MKNNPKNERAPYAGSFQPQGQDMALRFLPVRCREIIFRGKGFAKPSAETPCLNRNLIKEFHDGTQGLSSTVYFMNPYSYLKEGGGYGQ